jgi:pyruvate dehydrogenase E1 component alpha subunit
MAPAAKNKVAGWKEHAASGERLLLCAATARGLQAAGSGVAVALMSAQAAEPGWREAFVWAQRERLPLVFVCTDTGERPRKAKDAPSWPDAAKVTHGVQLPTITVDGEDAVAMFRVMQEATLRARTASGPSVVWAVLSPSRAALKPGALPVARLRKYMAVRGIPVEDKAPGRKPVH